MISREIEIGQQERKRMKCVFWVTKEHKENERLEGTLQDLKHYKCTAFVQSCKAFQSNLQPKLAPWTLEKEKKVAIISVCIGIKTLLAITDTAQHSNWLIPVFTMLIRRLPNLCYFWFSYARRDVLPLGKFTVNLSGCPRNSIFTEHIYRIIQQLVPAVRIMAL